MAAVDANFNGNIFQFNQPLVIAMNRSSAVLIGLRLRYDGDGYPAGQVLARNTTDGWYQKYDSGGSSGTDTAACILFEAHPAEDFDSTASTGSTAAVGIFGGCAVYKDRLADYDADVLTDIKGRIVIGANGDELILF